jgi:hypothetical protein
MRKLVSARVPRWQLALIHRRGRRHRLDKLPGDSGSWRTGRHGTDPPRFEKLAYAGDVITHDRARDAQGFHHRHWVRLIVRQRGDDARLGQRGGHTLAIRRRYVLDADPVGNSKMAGKFVQITFIRAPSQDQQVGFRNLTPDVRQRLDDPVMPLVAF